MRALFTQYTIPVEAQDFEGDLRIDLDLSEHVQSRLFWLGYYNHDIVPLIHKILHTDMVAIDAGANIG